MLFVLPVRIEHVVSVQVAVIHIANIEVAIAVVGIDTAGSHPSIMPYYFNYHFVAIITKIIYPPFPCWPARVQLDPIYSAFQTLLPYSTSNTFSLSWFRSSELRETTGKRPRLARLVPPARAEHAVAVQVAIIHTANIEIAIA